MMPSDVKELIKRELPVMFREDGEIHQFIVELTSPRYADKQVTESRFDRILDELQRDREEQRRKWDENQQTIQAMLARIDAQQQKHDSSIGALGARWGLQAEEAFRNALAGILEQSFGVQVVNVTEFDETGDVFGHPDQVELDVIIHNGTLILCEIKSSMSRGDVYIFSRKATFYERLHQCKADRRIIITPMIREDGRRTAAKLNIEVYSYAQDLEL